MDLLGGYDSNTDSQNDTSDDENQIGTVDTPQMRVLPQPKLKPTPTYSVSKQKKRLLSLNAVLPTEIFERLTRTVHQDDSSDDEGDVEYHRQNILAKDSETNKESLMRNKGKIESLLSDLKTNIAAPVLSNKAIKLKENKDSNPDKNHQSYSHKNHDEKMEEKSEKMGLAFTNIVSTTTTRKRVNNNNAEVVDIHQPQTTSPPPELSKVHPSNEKSKVILAPSSPSSRLRINVPRPVHHSLGHTPLKVAVSATPTISSSLMSTYSKDIPLYSTNEQHPPQSHPLNSQSQVNKKSKREMQKALRSGDFANLSNELITNIENPNNSNNSYATTLAQAQTSQLSSNHIPSVSSSEIYDPKRGQMVPLMQRNANNTDVVGLDAKKITGKLKSKHQIHQLVQSARTLEANRRIQNQMGYGSGRRSGRMVDAKRKYGW